MSNRIFNQALAIEKQVVHLYGSLLIGTTGAVTSIKGISIASIVKETAAGLYTITLTDAYDRFLMFNATMNSNAVGGSATPTIELANDPATMVADFKTKSFKIQLLDKTGAAANAVSGSVLYFEIIARRSSVGPA